MKSFHWRKLAVIYDSDDALVRFREIYPLSYETDFAGRPVTVRFHRIPENTDGYFVMLKNLTKSNVSSIIVDCSLKNTQTLLNLTHRFSMNNEYYVCITITKDPFIHWNPIPINASFFVFSAIFHRKLWCIFINWFQDNSKFYRQCYNDPIVYTKRYKCRWVFILFSAEISILSNCECAFSVILLFKWNSIPKCCSISFRRKRPW